MTRRLGASTLGCLFTLLIVIAVMYFGVNVGRVYWRFYEFQDDMRQEVRFAASRTNDQILGHLQASADSLGLPSDAARVAIRRSDRAIAVESDYYEAVELPMFVKQVHFHPHAEGTL